MTTDVAGLVLAGGLSRRMGGVDKPLIAVEGKTLLARVVERLAPQVGRMVLNANGDATRFADFGLPVAADVVDGFAGPLVGVLTGLEWLRANAPEVRSMVTVAADTPLFPDDLVARLAGADGDIAMASSNGRTHPVFALWPVALADDLRRAVVDEGVRKIEAFTDRYRVARIDWPDRPVDPFFNVNTPEDVIRLRMVLAGTLPAEPPVTAAMPVAVVVERRDTGNIWAPVSWRPIEVLPEPPTAAPWTRLKGDGTADVYLASGLEMRLHRSDLASYRYNLAGVQPQVFVALRRDGDDLRVVLVTAAPDEAQGLAEGGDDVIEGLPMPAMVRDFVETFCACHPPEEPMRKRRRDRLDAEQTFTAGRRP
ncbi:MAG: molybdenum cofactor guanylyltransferase MobA [Actinomycetota bacterium]